MRHIKGEIYSSTTAAEKIIQEQIMSRRTQRQSTWQRTQSTRYISQRSIPTKKANRKTEDIEEAEEIDISNTIQLERDRKL